MKKLLLLLLSIFIFGCQKYYDPFHSKSQWLKDFFSEVQKYDSIRAIAYWNENFDNTYLKINSSKKSLQTFRKLISSPIYLSECRFDQNNKLLPPSGKQKYFGAFPDFSGSEDTVNISRIKNFEKLINKKIAWAYFSNNWYDTLIFPTEAVKSIIASGSIPFIRLMPRSEFEQYRKDPRWDFKKIIEKKYDKMLIAWAQEAKKINSPILVEFGTEVNGDWFSWNGKYYGGGETQNYGDPNYPDGPEIFRDAYRHIIEICRENNVNNITWFFHFDDESEPAQWWNAPKYYYPGDDYIDWIGISSYGPMSKKEKYRDYNPKILIPRAYMQLREVSPNKPYAILEFGCTEM